MPTATAWRECWVRLIDCRPGEGRMLSWAFASFLSLLCGYYARRPIREGVGVRIGPKALQWAFNPDPCRKMLALAPLYGWAAARLRRRALLMTVFAIMALVLAVF